MEQSPPPKKNYTSASFTSTKNPYNAFKTVGFDNKNAEYKPPAVVQKQREPGKCWRCGDALFHGHMCKQAPIINMLTGEEPTDQSKEQETVSDEECYL